MSTSPTQRVREYLAATADDEFGSFEDRKRHAAEYLSAAAPPSTPTPGPTLVKPIEAPASVKPTTPPVNVESNGEVPTFHSTRKALDEIRKGLEIDPDTGKTVKRHQHFVNRDFYRITKEFCEARGEFFRAGPNAWYLDKVDHCLIPMDKDDPAFARMLRNLGFLANEPHTRILSRTLIEYAFTTKRKAVYPFAHMTLDNTIYIRTSETRMLKITPDTITEVPIGTDDVVLFSDDLGELPTFEELKPHLDELRDLVGKTTTAAIPGSPLSKLTTRWETDGILTPQQQDEMFLARLLFFVAAERYELWPLLLHTGGENAGKSTPFELALAMFRGERVRLRNMPGEEKDFVAAITNSALAVFDNIDGAGLHLPKKSGYSDLICQVATGGEVNLRRLFANNKLDKHKLQAHAFFTARVVPFDRADVMRRAIHLQLTPPDEKSEVVKGKLLNRVLADRLPMLAEFILRAQNIARAHVAHADAEYTYQSQMREYEHYTLVCAEYEDRLAKTEALWAAYMRKHATTITQDNPVVFLLRLWIGKSGNDNRPVSTTTLHAELRALAEDLHANMPYKSATSLGIIMAKNRPPLRAIGWEEIRGKSSSPTHIFKPSAEELEIARKHYSDARVAGDKFTPSFGLRKPFEPECEMQAEYL